MKSKKAKSTIFWLALIMSFVIFSVVKWLVPLFYNSEDFRIITYVVGTIIGIAYIIFCLVDEYNYYYKDSVGGFKYFNFIHQINKLIDVVIPTVINKNKKK